ncbi:MAG: non-canonical purine NTP pyrophosphatase, partial [Leptospiraceae bacterium]|nr:non-canonical purine NTP pyrophosphatase [Leptospiraceae bacterium]
KIVSGFVLAEDSGFEVERLGRSPGVHSARYAPDDASRCEKILRALQGVPENKRTAQFVACVVLLEDGRNPIYFFGRCQGRVAESRRGSGGFGYDPIFIPDGENQTWGELPPEKKRQHSHRSQAFARAIDYLVVRLSQLSIATGIRTGSHSSDG